MYRKISIRKALRLQLGYVKRNIQSIQNLLDQGATLTEMDKKSSVVIGDKAYPTRENRSYCNQRGIRLSCAKLGRKTAEEVKKERKQLYDDGCERNATEGSFGVCKRKFGLSLIMAKLAETSRTAISMGFFVANMERKLRFLSAQNSNAVVFYDYDLSCLVRAHTKVGN